MKYLGTLCGNFIWNFLLYIMGLYTKISMRQDLWEDFSKQN